MKPNNSILDHGNKNQAEKWTCTAPDQTQPVVPETSTETETNATGVNRIPKGTFLNSMKMFENYCPGQKVVMLDR